MSVDTRIYVGYLTPKELLALDGITEQPELIAKIQSAKQAAQLVAEASDPVDLLVRQILAKALERHEVTHRYCTMARCCLCGARTVADTYKSGRRKGQIKPVKDGKIVSGFCYDSGFVRFQPEVGLTVCNVCDKIVNPKVTAAILTNRLPILYPGSPYKKDQGRICFECGKFMWESEMGMLPALMGGYYPGRCPHCRADSLPFGRSHKISPRWRLRDPQTGDVLAEFEK